MSARWLTGESARAPWLAVAAVVVVFVAAHLDLGAIDSFRTTWEAVASGAERVPANGQVAVWEAPRNVVVAEPATVLHLAERVGSAGSASFWLLVAALGVVGAAGAFAIGLDLGLAPPTAGLAAAAAGSLFLASGQGLWGTLAAAPLIWVVRGVVGGRGLALPIAVVALGVLSRPGTLLAMPVLVAAILARGATPAVALSLALTLGFVIPPNEADWARFLRLRVGHYFAYGAPYGLPDRGYRATLAASIGAAHGDGIALAAGLASWGAAAVGAVRTGRRGCAFLVAAAGFAALVTRPPGRLHEWASSPAAFLATIAPSLQVYDLARIGGSIAALLLPPLAARGIRRPLAAALAMLALVALGWRGGSERETASSRSTGSLPRSLIGAATPDARVVPPLAGAWTARGGADRTGDQARERIAGAARRTRADPSRASCARRCREPGGARRQAPRRPRALAARLDVGAGQVVGARAGTAARCAAAAPACEGCRSRSSASRPAGRTTSSVGDPERVDPGARDRPRRRHPLGEPEPRKSPASSTRSTSAANTGSTACASTSRLAARLPARLPRARRPGRRLGRHHRRARSLLGRARPGLDGSFPYDDGGAQSGRMGSVWAAPGAPPQDRAHARRALL